MAKTSLLLLSLRFAKSTTYLMTGQFRVKKLGRMGAAWMTTTIELTEKQKDLLYWLTERQKEALQSFYCNKPVGGGWNEAHLNALSKKGLARSVSVKPRRWSLTDDGKLLAAYLQREGNVPSAETNHPATPFIPLCLALTKIVNSKTLKEAREIATSALVKFELDSEAVRDAVRPRALRLR
jgi:hypothetical protein